MSTPNTDLKPTRPTTPPFGRASAAVDGPRRLQRMGAVTVGVSLPRAWIGERGLAAGSSIQLRSLPDGSLLLRDRVTAPALGRSTIIVRDHESPEHLFRELIGAYLGGASEFILEQPEGLSHETRSVARTFTRRTVQPEIVSDEGSTLVLRDVSLGTGLPLPQLIKRMFQIVLDLHRDAGRSWVENGPLPLEALAVKDDEVDRHAWLVERVLGMRIGSEQAIAPRSSSFDDPLQCLLTTRALERIADHAVILGEDGACLVEAAPPKRLTTALTDYHAQAVENLRAAFAVAERPDADRANEVIDAGEALHSKHVALFDGFLSRGNLVPLPPSAIAQVSRILQSIDRTAAYAQDIAQVGLDRAAWSEIGRASVTPTDRLPLTSTGPAIRRRDTTP